MSRYFKFLVIYFAIICVDNVISDSVKITRESNDFVTIQTPKAQVHGKILKSRLGSDILAFRGIRYAEPPIGERRFQAPVPRTELIGNVNAISDGWICPQSEYPSTMVNEDCLILNVYTKRHFHNTPVLVYIYGGSLVVGSSHSELDIGPQYFLDKDVVFVTLNYRLSAFGFLTTGDKSAPGYAGFKDQVAALRWVQKNIKYFGGDPNSVTLAGESSGSLSIGLHILSPMSCGLFHKAIMLSSALTGQYSYVPRDLAQKLGNSLNCPTTNSASLVKCLQQVPTETLVNKTDSLISIIDYGSYWSYVPEGDYGQERFIIENPMKLLVQGQFPKVPIIISMTNSEIFQLYEGIESDPFWNDVNGRNFDEMAPNTLLFRKEQNASAIATAIKPLYIKKLESGLRIFDLKNLFNDNYMVYGIHWFAKYAKLFTSVWYFVLDFSDSNKDEVYHAEDVKYMFPSKDSPIISFSDRKNIMVERYTTWFSSFAKYGNPNVKQNKFTVNCNLVESCPKKIIATFVNETCYTGDEPHLDRFNVWDNALPIIPS